MLSSVLLQFWTTILAVRSSAFTGVHTLEPASPLTARLRRTVGGGMGRTWGGDGEDIGWGWGGHGVGMGRTWGGDGEDMGWGEEDMGWGRYTICAIHMV